MQAAVNNFAEINSLSHTTQRDEALDGIKGLLVLTVVYAHNSASHPFVLQFCHPALMGIFFMVSGYVINTRIKLAARIKMTVRQFLFFVLFSLVWRFLYGFISHEPLKLTDWGGSLLTGDDFGLNIPLWFLISYGEILVLCRILRYIKPTALQLPVTVGLMIAGVILKSYDINPLYLSQSMIYLPFFEMGAYMHKLRNGKNIPGFKYPLVILLLVGALIWERVNIPEIHFALRYLMDSILAVVFGVWLYLMLTMLRGKTIVLTFYGRHSLTVLCMHILILDVVWRLSYAIMGEPGSMAALAMTIAVAVLLVPCCILYDRYVAPWLKR